MKYTFTLFFFFLFQGILFSQDSQLYYEGYFYNTKNKPHKNLLVTNRNSGNYDYTNNKGYLIIQAKAGDTLAFNKKDIRIVQGSELREIKTILNSRKVYLDASPVFSKNYTDALKQNTIDSTDFQASKVKATIQKANTSNYKYIKIADSGYAIKKLESNNLFYSGSLSFTTEFGSPNVQPSLQTQYVQGRNSDGKLQWNGAETSEMFSFGPHISTLGFDGSLYEYDIHGRLVDKANSINAAKIYDNSILRPTQKYSSFLSINSYYEKGGYKKWNAALDLGWVYEDLIIKNQYQDTKNFGFLLGKQLFEFHNLSFNYKYNQQNATNTNRIGLFNRIYKNSLLTPISFDNQQGNLLPEKQRSYSEFSDNPDYLMHNERKYNFNYYQNLLNVKFSKENYGKLRYFFDQSYENTQFSNFDSYQMYTAGFFGGKQTEREQKNNNYSLNFGGSYQFQSDYDELHKLYFNAFLANSDIKISYTGLQNNHHYHYHRFAQDYILKYQFRFSDFVFRDFTLEGEIGNGFYMSDTSAAKEFFIPKTSVSLNMRELIGYNFHTKVFGSFHKNIFEPDLTKSYSNFLLTQLDPQQLNTYFPMLEISNYKNLQYIENLEYKAGVVLYDNYRYELEGSITTKKYFNDAFPVFEGQQMMLKNLVDHTETSYDINLSTRNFPFRNGTIKIGFNKSRSEVTSILENYEKAPIIGFSSVYRGIAEGQPLGVIIGSAYQRNVNDDVIIGSDGFPLISSEKKILGNPIPDFTMKFSFNQNIRNFNLNIDVEWRKGGDVWNGTQSNLDYYGRSQSSAEGRNISGYIFPGVSQNENPNTIPVDFYNLNNPFNENKWYRYGSLGVAEDHILKGDAVRINNITLSYTIRQLEFLKSMRISVFTKNILLWSKSKLDPQTSFFDNENGQGLNFYNLPSLRSYGCSVSFLF